MKRANVRGLFPSNSVVYWTRSPECEIETALAESRDASRSIYAAAPDYGTVEELIAADSDKLLTSFADCHPPLFFTKWNGANESSDEEAVESVDAYRDARTMLMIAIDLAALVDRHECSFESFSEIGLSESFSLDAKYMPKREYYELWFNENLVTSGAYKAMLAYASVDVSNGTNIRTHAVLHNASDEEERRESDIQKYLNPDFHSFFTFPRKAVGDFRETAAIEMFDNLVNMHCSDIRFGTVSGEPKIICRSYLSSMWAVVLQTLGAGRAGRCRVCHRPFISLEERGTPREFCTVTDKCKKWEQRNPGKHRFEQIGNIQRKGGGA